MFVLFTFLKNIVLKSMRHPFQNFETSVLNHFHYFVKSDQNIVQQKKIKKMVWVA